MLISTCHDRSGVSLVWPSRRLRNFNTSICFFADLEHRKATPHRDQEPPNRSADIVRPAPQPLRKLILT
jgi:hypothetical protein